MKKENGEFQYKRIFFLNYYFECKLGDKAWKLIRCKYVKGEKSKMKVSINIPKNLGRWANKMERLGRKIEKAVRESGLEELGDTIEFCFRSSITDKEQMKKRVSGLIKVQKAQPIKKLAESLNITYEDAENPIYELVADGIEGSLEEGVFKFTNTPEEVISKLHGLIDNL